MKIYYKMSRDLCLSVCSTTKALETKHLLSHRTRRYHIDFRNYWVPATRSGFCREDPKNVELNTHHASFLRHMLLVSQVHRTLQLRDSVRNSFFCRFVWMSGVDAIFTTFLGLRREQSHQKFKTSASSWSRSLPAHWAKQRGHQHPAVCAG